MNSPTLSVLMPVHDGLPYLPKTLESILGQTFGDFECLIIDDGSTDDTWAHLTAIAAQDSRVGLQRNEQNLGITRSMNKLFALARGKYITRHDADDLSAPERFERQVSFLEAQPEIGLLGTWVEIVNSDGAPLDLAMFPPVTDDESIQQALLEGNPLCQGSVMFRRECLEAVGYYDEELEPTEDYDLWLRVAEVTRTACLGERLYRYRFHPASISNRRNGLQMLQLGQALEKALYRRDGSAPAAERLRPVARRYLRSAIAVYISHDLALARRCLARAQALWPGLLAADEPLGGLALEPLAALPVEEGLTLCRGLFTELLPLTPHLARLKERLLAELHMREVFAGARQGQGGRVRAHLGPGLRHDPAWLMNRGVLSILARSVLRRDARPMPEHRD